LFSGYWSEPPHSTDAWFRTGDLGYFDRQGCLHVTGRASELIITGGENVHPAEIEAVVQRVVGTRRICVVGLADEIWGQRVVLAIEGMRDERMALEVAQLVRQKLAGFKRPRELVFLEKFPELPSGKVARRAVAEACSESIGQPTS
jgi:acyl-CoA synthetase (AMP-forming)/AMP-acid ligase II